MKAPRPLALWNEGPRLATTPPEKARDDQFTLPVFVIALLATPNATVDAPRVPRARANAI
jgi:hypothetical protein